MKLDAIETRHRAAQDKRAGDGWDLYRIVVDLDADETVGNALATGSSWWCAVEVPALLFRVGGSVADRCGHVRRQVVQHDVDRVPVGSEFDRDLVQSATAHAADSGPGTRDRHSSPRSLPKQGEKWLAITSNGFIRPPPSTPRISWSSLLSLRPREDSNLRLWFRNPTLRTGVRPGQARWQRPIGYSLPKAFPRTRVTGGL
jgi:hypothetical protein